jgi:hypothetical protein
MSHPFRTSHSSPLVPCHAPPHPSLLAFTVTLPTPRGCYTCIPRKEVRPSVLPLVLGPFASVSQPSPASALCLTAFHSTFPLHLPRPFLLICAPPLPSSFLMMTVPSLPPFRFRVFPPFLTRSGYFSWFDFVGPNQPPLRRVSYVNGHWAVGGRR